MYRSLAVVSLIFCCHAGAVVAQGNDPGGNQGGGNQGGGNQNGFPGGIRIDADGMIRQVVADSAKSQRFLKQLRQSSRTVSRSPSRSDSDVGGRVVTESPLRYVSLRRLESECQNLVNSRQQTTPEIRALAGLTQITAVYFGDAVDFSDVDFSDKGSAAASDVLDDVIIAGPAEALAEMPDGRIVGAITGRPVVMLEDLLVVLRYAKSRQPVGCSFDPRPEGLAESQKFLKQNQQQLSIQAGVRMFDQMARIMGSWQVSVQGIPADTPMAHGLVEADFQLKQVTLGLENPSVRGFRSQLMMLKPGDDIMRRWWFVPQYDAIESDADGLCYVLSGPRIQLLGQDEVVDAAGNRHNAVTTNKSSEAYAAQFSEHIQELAANVPAFAHLQNLIDLLMVNALIDKARSEGICRWEPGVFALESEMPIRRQTAPTQVPAMANARTVGRSLLVGLVAGGVTVDTGRVLRQIRPSALPINRPIRDSDDKKGHWWWDAEEVR